MRLFAKPPWAEDFKCKCGGKIVIQPWTAVAFIDDKQEEIQKVLDMTKEEVAEAKLSRENRFGILLSGAAGINYICCKCRKQWRDLKYDWASLSHTDKWREHFQKYRQSMGGDFDEDFHEGDDMDYHPHPNRERKLNEEE